MNGRKLCLTAHDTFDFDFVAVISAASIFFFSNKWDTLHTSADYNLNYVDYFLNIPVSALLFVKKGKDTSHLYICIIMSLLYLH